MRSMRTWLLAMLVVAGLFGGVYYVATRSGTAATTQQASTSYTQTIAVTRGNITAAISPIGEVVSPRSKSLSFDVSALTPIIELNVSAGQQVGHGDVLATIDPSALQRAVEQAEADLLSAQDELDTAQQTASALDLQKARLAVAGAELSLQEAQQAREDLLNPDLEAAQQAVTDAEFNLQSAQLNLQLTRISTSVTKAVRDAEYAVAWNERNVRDIQASSGATTMAMPDAAAEGALVFVSTGVAAQVPGPRPGGVGSNQEPMTLEEAQQALADAKEQLRLAQLSAATALANAESRVTQAEQSLADAQKNLADLLAGPGEADVRQADSAIAQAELKVAQAQAALDDLTAGADSRTVELAKAKVSAAQATLDEAQAALDGAVMLAPFDGTIISVDVEAGDEVSAGHQVLSIADLSQLQVLAQVDETEITQVKVGQAVQITFDAFPGQAFEGEVLEVPVEGTLSQNVVTYEVPISLENAATTPIKPGMTANLNISTGSRENVLLLPAYAVQYTSDGIVVTVQDTAGTVVVPVRVGLTDGVYIEIVRGLNEGDTVVTQYEQSGQATGGFNRMGGGQMQGIMGAFR